MLYLGGCEGTGKINRIRNLITPLKKQNHSVDDYKSEVFKLKTKCKTMAKQVETTGLREVFDDVPGTIYVRVVFLLLSANSQCIVPEEKHNQRSH